MPHSQPQCASLRITDCNQLAREWSRDAILGDDVCSAQCGLVLQTGQPNPNIPGSPLSSGRSQPLNSFVPDFSIPSLRGFLG